MWDLRVCRGCLVTDKEGKLEPINKMLKMGYQALTGLEMKDGDGYPTYFCLECCVHIKKAWAFRRKSRRAFFVMKEMMIIRNEVSIKDIQTINREKTHLNSSSSYWNLKNNTIINIDNTEDEVYSMVEYTPVIDNLVCHNVEVIPEITENIEEEEVEPVEDTIDNIDDDNVPENIDLEDVFKDLKEESSSESEIEELKVEKVEKKKKKKHPSKASKAPPYAFDVQIYKACKALCNTDIVVLSELDQKSMHVIRSKMPPFATAKFKCALCLIVFKDIDNLIKHVEDHKSKRGDLICGVCKNMFETTELLDKHKAENHAYEYTCKICSVIMYTLLDVIQHNEQKHPEVLTSAKIKMSSLRAHFKFKRLSPLQMYTSANNKMTCPKCNMYFRNRHEFSEHMSDHKWPNRYYCDICLRYNRNKGSLQNHMMTFHFHTYRCKQCSVVFTSRIKAKNHIRDGFCKYQGEVKCNICDEKVLKSEVHLSTHNFYRHYSLVYMHECNLCGQSYTTLSALYKHQIKMHKYISPMDPKLGSPEHACIHCNYQFYSRRAYQKHAVRANHPEVEHFENGCRPCRRLFNSEEECRNHTCVRGKDLEYPRRCDYCDITLIDAVDRIKHHKKAHPNLTYSLCENKTKLCQICGAILAQGRLRKHMKTHNGDLLNKYECSRCEPSTCWPNVYNYMDHVIQTHTHEPYHCTVCYAAFRYKSVCRDHILKIHSPAMLYACGHCKQQFCHRDYLIDHTKKIHDIKMKKIKPQRLRKNIFVYPHMKIDVSLVEREILNVIKVDLYDYLHKTYKELDDPTNYLITDSFFQCSKTTTPKKRKVQNRSVKISKKPKLGVEHTIKREESIITTRTVIFDRKRVKAKPGANENNAHIAKDEVADFQDESNDMINETVVSTDFLVNNINSREIKENNEESEVYDNKGEKTEMYHHNGETSGVNDDIKEESYNFESKVIKNELTLKGELIETASEEVVEECIDQELELIDINGENYVMLNGILYKVETH